MKWAGDTNGCAVANALEWLFGADPGWLRLWTAARVVVSAATTLTVLLLLQHRIAIPIDAIGIGLMVSNFASVAVRDPSPAQQQTTTLAIPLPAMAAWAAAAALNPWPWIADLGFIAVVFVAGLARLAGPRGMALGMVGYISYFIGEVTRSQLRHYPFILLAVAIAVGAAYLSRFLLIPHDPEATLARVLGRLRRRVVRILDEIACASKNP